MTYVAAGRRRFALTSCFAYASCVASVCGIALSGGCSAHDEPEESLRSVALELGEPQGDYPNYNERVVLYATNKARTDPAAENWPSYPKGLPFQYNYDLNRSARAHSADMAATPC